MNGRFYGMGTVARFGANASMTTIALCLIGIALGSEPRWSTLFADAAAAFLIPLVFIGASRAAASDQRDANDFWARPYEPDLEYAFAWVIGCVGALVSSFFDFEVLPISGAASVAAAGLVGLDWKRMAVLGTAVGFSITVALVSGASSGWRFPWALLAVGIAWYLVWLSRRPPHWSKEFPDRK